MAAKAAGIIRSFFVLQRPPHGLGVKEQGGHAAPRVVQAFPTDEVLAELPRLGQLSEFCFPALPLGDGSRGDLGPQQHVFAVTQKSGTRLHVVVRRFTPLKPLDDGTGTTSSSRTGRVDARHAALSACMAFVSSRYSYFDPCHIACGGCFCLL